MLANGEWERRANISWNSFVVSIQPSCESPDEAEHYRADRNGRKVPKCAPERGCDHCGLFPELIAEVVQRSRVKHQRGCHDECCQENIQAKLPDSCLGNEQPHRKKPHQDGVQEELQ